MLVVLDASAAVRLALGQSNYKMVAETLKQADWVVAPSLYLYEIAYVMWKYCREGSISQEILGDKILSCAGLIDELIPAVDLYAECFELACRLGQSAYDMAYLASCLRKEAGLISFDRRMLERAEKLNIACY